MKRCGWRSTAVPFDEFYGGAVLIGSLLPTTVLKRVPKAGTHPVGDSHADSALKESKTVMGLKCTPFRFTQLAVPGYRPGVPVALPVGALVLQFRARATVRALPPVQKLKAFRNGSAQVSHLLLETASPGLES